MEEGAKSPIVVPELEQRRLLAGETRRRPGKQRPTLSDIAGLTTGKRQNLFLGCGIQRAGWGPNGSSLPLCATVLDKPAASAALIRADDGGDD